MRTLCGKSERLREQGEGVKEREKRGSKFTCLLIAF